MNTQKPLVFISHIHEDEDFAVSLKYWLRDALLDSLEFFIAGERGSVQLGREWSQKIADALRRCHVALLVVSPQSRDRKWIYWEAGAAFARSVPVIPVCCKGHAKSQLTPPFSLFRAVELPGKDDEEVLLREMAAVCDLRPPSNTPPFVESPSYYATRRASDAGEGGAELDEEFSSSAQSKSVARVVAPSSDDARIVSWFDIGEAATTLCDDVLSRGSEPDTIVGVGRGGAIAVGVVAARFRQRKGSARRLIPVQLLDRRHLRRDDRRLKTVITGLHTLDVLGRKVLVLNADSYTGATITEARDAIGRLSPAEVMTGALYMIKRNGGETPQDPQFQGQVLTGPAASVEFPWRGGRYRFEEDIDTTELLDRTLIVLHGLVGTGKTSVANAITKRLRCYPLHTDEFWFRHGLRDRHLDPGVSAEHYDLMRDLCWSVIGSGRDAVLDCTARWQSFRRKLLRSFKEWGVTLVFVSCSCSESSILERIKQRKGFGPHDMGDEAEYRRVLHDYSPIDDKEARLMNLIRLDTDKMTCTESNVLKEDADRVHKVREAIESGYLGRMLTRSGAV